MRQVLRRYINEILMTSSTFGVLPPVEWFQDRIEKHGEVYHNLQGLDSLVYWLAMKEAGVSGRTDSPEELRKTIQALMNCPSYEELPDPEDPDFPAEATAIMKRYPKADPQIWAKRLASDFMGLLGEEWV